MRSEWRGWNRLDLYWGNGETRLEGLVMAELFALAGVVWAIYMAHKIGQCVIYLKRLTRLEEAKLKP